VVHQLFIDSNKAYVLGNILIEFGIPVKQVKVIKMCLNETYSNVWVSKCLSDTFPVKNGLKHVHALLLLIFNFALEYAITWVQAGEDCMKLNGIHHLMLIYWVKAYVV